jgi:UDP-2,3-diacylglucosamine hydrolase
VFASPFAQWLFARIHPNWGMGMAQYWSGKSRRSTGDSDAKFLGEEKEWLAIYAKEILQKEHFDYFIFGHRHLPLDLKIAENSRYINLGEWVNFSSYAVFDGNNLELKYFKTKDN